MTQTHPQYDTFSIEKNLKRSHLLFYFGYTYDALRVEVSLAVSFKLIYQLFTVLYQNEYNSKYTYGIVVDGYGECNLTFEFAGTTEPLLENGKDTGIEDLKHLDLRILITKDKDILGEFIKPDIAQTDLLALIHALSMVSSLNTDCSLNDVVNRYTTTLYSDPSMRHFRVKI